MELKARDVCRTEYPAIRASESIRAAAAQMTEHQTRWLTVTSDGLVLGLVSDWDIISKSVIGGLDQDSTPVESIMRVGLPTCTPETAISQVARIMRKKRIRQLAVVRDHPRRELVGVVRFEDIIRVLNRKSLEPDFLLAVLS